ncbi:acyl carrier protein, partial [Mycolicibacterium sp.]|uniref:acyl carrier protein n=1 Tax=Mycolicibacterium sp. TaxID=2320850 RepID=UPI003D0C5FB1
CLHASGASAVRAHVSVGEGGTCVVDLSDVTGLPVLTGSLTTRPMPVEKLRLQRLDSKRTPTEHPVRRAASSRPANLVTKLAEMPPEEQRSQLLNILVSDVAIALGHSGPEDIDIDMPFDRMGFDSLSIMAFSQGVSYAIGDRLQVSTINAYPTISQLVDYLLENPKSLDE